MRDTNEKYHIAVLYAVFFATALLCTLVTWWLTGVGGGHEIWPLVPIFVISYIVSYVAHCSLMKDWKARRRSLSQGEEEPWVRDGHMPESFVGNIMAGCLPFVFLALGLLAVIVLSRESIAWLLRILGAD